MSSQALQPQSNTELVQRAEEMVDKIIKRSTDPVAILMLSELRGFIKRLGRRNELKQAEIVRLNTILEFERATREQIVSMEVQERMIHEIFVDGQD